jgi:membrane protease YdiL (CAAX protease family)
VDTDKIEFNPSSFIKNEWFWAAIVAIAFTAGIIQDAGSFQQQPSPDHVSQQIRAINQKLLRPSSHQTAEYVLLFAGALMFVALAVIRIWRPLIRPVPAPAPVWGLWDALKVGALYILGAVLFASIFRPNPVAPMTDNRGWFADIFVRILVNGAIISVVIDERAGRWADLGFRGKLLRNILIGAAAFLALQPVLFLIQWGMSSFFEMVPLQESLRAIYEGKSASLLVIASFTAIVLAPLSEELLFRAYLQPVLERWFGWIPGIIMTSALFAAAHGDMFAIITTFVLGLTLGYIYNRTRSLAAPVCLHMLFNGVAVVGMLSRHS